MAGRAPAIRGAAAATGIKFPLINKHLAEGERPRIAPDARSTVPLQVRQTGLFRMLETILQASYSADSLFSPSDLPALVAKAVAEEQQLAWRVASKEAYGVHLVSTLRRLKASSGAAADAAEQLDEADCATMPNATARAADGAARPGATKRSWSKALTEGSTSPTAAPAGAIPRVGFRVARPLGVRREAAPLCPVCGEPAGVGVGIIVEGGDTWHQACVDATAL